SVATPPWRRRDLLPAPGRVVPGRAAPVGRARGPGLRTRALPGRDDAGRRAVVAARPGCRRSVSELCRTAVEEVDEPPTPSGAASQSWGTDFPFESGTIFEYTVTCIKTTASARRRRPA